MDSDLLQGFYLNNVLVEPRKGRVLRDGEPVHLPPKAMDVLLALASRPAALVSRQALIDRVWGAGQGSPEALGVQLGVLLGNVTLWQELSRARERLEQENRRLREVVSEHDRFGELIYARPQDYSPAVD